MSPPPRFRSRVKTEHKRSRIDTLPARVRRITVAVPHSAGRPSTTMDDEEAPSTPSRHEDAPSTTPRRSTRTRREGNVHHFYTLFRRIKIGTLDPSDSRATGVASGEGIQSDYISSTTPYVLNCFKMALAPLALPVVPSPFRQLELHLGDVLRPLPGDLIPPPLHASERALSMSERAHRHPQPKPHYPSISAAKRRTSTFPTVSSYPFTIGLGKRK